MCYYYIINKTGDLWVKKFGMLQIALKHTEKKR